MDPRVRISSQVDHDQTWARFERNSGLPRDAFNTGRSAGDVAVWIVIGLAVLAFVLGWIS